ncbi:hypothetical protein AHAS_Ahas17G0272400 [Arachis hypogaea]
MIVKGLSHIHRKGIVHCDLKPENILVFPSLDKEIANYQLKIADFGLSKTKEEEADVELWKSKPRGTLSYLSLEAFFGHIDAPMDIWAPGCIVIKILTGFLAWGESVLHEDYLTYLVEHFGESPKKPQGIGFFCSNFLEKCFMKNPSKRKPLPETEVSVYARMSVKGLSHIHRKGLVHCDLKPENILVFPSLDKEIANYQLNITDFGLSKTKEEEADVELWKSKPRGTLSYLLPEEFSGHIDAPMDIWALGCIVIEMLTGLPAWDDLIHKKPLPETEVSVYARMSVKGLSHIHHKGLVHCDLKPENILVFPSLDKEIANYQLKIMDFELSKTKEEEADVELWKSKPRGTLSYLSPEAFFGHIDAPMDIWALGCIVIEMLTGLPAWGESVLHEEYLGYLVEHFGESPKKPQGIDFFCYDFLENCFMKDPSKRWTADMLFGTLLLQSSIGVCSHGSLDDLIHKKPLPETEVSVYARMSVKGLSHIHRKGLVHCDLKPENILVFPSLDKEIANYQLKITDFELSKTKEEEADVELWKSKPRGMLSYLSPEAFSGHIDAPIDIWALGCIVIEMLTGLPAWDDLIHKKPLPETEVSVYARMSVKGLSHIHHKGLVHCDLKPENILVFPSLDKEIANYQLKITDFELSKTKEEEADVEL